MFQPQLLQLLFQLNAPTVLIADRRMEAQIYYYYYLYILRKSNKITFKILFCKFIKKNNYEQMEQIADEK